MNSKKLFQDLSVGDSFLDLNSGDYFIKRCGNAAEWLKGGDYFTGQLAIFDNDEFVILTEANYD